jgi:hypothetical protein
MVVSLTSLRSPVCKHPWDLLKVPIRLPALVRVPRYMRKLNLRLLDLRLANGRPTGFIRPGFPSPIPLRGSQDLFCTSDREVLCEFMRVLTPLSASSAAVSKRGRRT